SDNSHDILKSGVLTVKTPELKDGETYRLALINAPQNFDEAKKYQDQPIIGLYDAKNQLLVQQAGAKDAARTWFANNVLTKTVEMSSKSATSLNQPAPVYAQAASVATVATPQTQFIGQNDQQLIQLWQKASKAERQKFMTWLAEQTNEKIKYKGSNGIDAFLIGRVQRFIFGYTFNAQNLENLSEKAKNHILDYKINVHVTFLNLFEKSPCACF